MHPAVLPCFVLAVAALGAGPAFGQRLGAPDLEEVRASLETEVADLIMLYQVWDRGHNEGKGASGATTSGGLGWGEASFLRNYMRCFRVTEDPYWLDKIVDHFDRMVGNLRENDRGFLAWDDPAYSVNVITAEPVGDVGEATIAPAVQRPWKRANVPDVTGHDYELSFPEAGRFILRDVTADAQVAAGEYDGAELVLKQIEPATLTVTGQVAPGAKFLIRTVAPERCEYQVHDGEITYPIAQFIEEVLTSAELEAGYGDKAREYLALLDRHFLEKWEHTWRDLDDGAGVYVFTDNATQRFAGYSLPHNQYLALGRTWLVLADVPGYGNADLARARATAMARHFEGNLREVDAAYEWNYWDPLPGEQASRYPEGFSYSVMDAGFAAEAAARGIVFGEEDLRRFASTFVDVMWNGDLDRPRFGSRVDTSEGDRILSADFMLLAPADLRLWALGHALYQERGRGVGMTPTVLDVYRELVGVSEEQRQRARANTARIAALHDEAFPNFDFELGALYWTPGVWGGEADQSYVRWTEEGRTGKRAVALVGRGERVNVLVQHARRFAVEGKSSIRLSAWYRTEGEPRPHFSILAYDAGGERVQYVNSPPFALSEQWAQAAHEFRLEAGVTRVEILLRNGAVGTVHYDDVEVDWPR